MRVSIVQMNVQPEDVRGNWDKAYVGLQDAARRHSQTILLPEMWSTGFSPRIRDVARDAFLPTLDFLRDAAKEAGAWVLSSIPEISDDRVFNTLFYVSPKGEVAGRYQKIHLFPLIEEHAYITAGSLPLTVDTPWCRIGGMICFDLRFPELARRLALLGARVLLVPAQFPHPRQDHWITLLRARAIENQLYMVAANIVGSSGKQEFFGHSCVVDPWGQVCDALDDQPGVVTVDLDLDTIETVRSRLPAWPARRADVYGNCEA